MTTSISDAGVMFADGSFVASAKELAHFNDIVNGDFRIAQAGTSFPAPVAGTYDLDGWLNSNTSTAVFTVAQVAGSTTGRLARRVTITTAKAVVAAGDSIADQTRIEGYNIEKYVGQTFTVSFKKSFPVAGIHCVALRNSGFDRSYVAEINVPVANVVQNCSFTVVGGLPTAGTWNYSNGIGLIIDFSHMAGTTWQTTPNAWNTGNFIATANQVNDCATVGNAWAMEKVTLNLGTVAAVSEISVEQELVRCLRYFELQVLSIAGVATANGLQSTHAFVVQKRAPPTLTAAGGSFGLSATTDAVDLQPASNIFSYRYILVAGSGLQAQVSARTIAIAARL